MNLLGLAILGKSNAPLYMCDCTRLVEGSESTEKDEEKTKEEDDLFGFAALSQSKGQRESLELDKQFMIHTALDPLEETIGKSNSDGSMPLRRTLYGAASMSSQWMGALRDVDEQYTVYGHVTATNIKLLALCRKPCKESVIRTFLSTIHEHYIHYVINPFSDIEGPIDSRIFDDKVKEAVRANYNTNNPLGIR